jgi:MYXO-CTERM domain-containing protein
MKNFFSSMRVVLIAVIMSMACVAQTDPASPGGAADQSDTRRSGQRTTGDGMDVGWVGVLGLAGLMGLRRPSSQRTSASEPIRP